MYNTDVLYLFYETFSSLLSCFSRWSVIFKQLNFWVLFMTSILASLEYSYIICIVSLLFFLLYSYSTSRLGYPSWSSTLSKNFFSPPSHSFNIQKKKISSLLLLISLNSSESHNFLSNFLSTDLYNSTLRCLFLILLLL